MPQPKNNEPHLVPLRRGSIQSSATPTTQRTARMKWMKKCLPPVCMMFKRIVIILKLNAVIEIQTRTSLGNPKDVDNEGLLVDVNVQPIDEDAPSREEKRRDIDHFFQPPVVKTFNGKMKKYCSCKLCPYVLQLFRFSNETNSCRDKKSLVNEVTTLRRHLEAHHSVSLLLLVLLSTVSYCSFFIGNVPQMGSRCKV